MTLQKQKKIAALSLSVLIVITGAAFLFATLHIFFTGDAKPYSRALVGEYLAYLSIPSVLTLIAAVWGGVLSLLSPSKERTVKVDLTKLTLSRMTKKLSLDECNADTKRSILTERRIRRALTVVSLVLIAICAIVSLIFALDFSRYTVEGHNADIISVLLIILPLSAVAIGSVSALTYFVSESCKRELVLVKAAVKAGTPLDTAEENDTAKCPITSFIRKNENRITLALRIAVAFLAVLFIALGITNGGMGDVLGKAVRICTECIGLG